MSSFPAETVLFLSSQINADKLFVVSCKHTFVSERRMAPDNGSTKCLVGWFQHMKASQFLVTVLRQPSENQVSRFVEQKEAVFVLD